MAISFIALPPKVLDFFAASTLAPRFLLPNLLKDQHFSEAHALQSFLSSIPEHVILALLDQGHFKNLHGNNLDLARQEIAFGLILENISRRRLATIADKVSSVLRPYDAVDLVGVTVDEEGMVKMSNFACDGTSLIKGFTRFTLLPTTALAHSSHWLLENLLEAGLKEVTSVRLDPFLIQPLSSPVMAYKMKVYGQDLNWDRIGTLKQPEFGRFMADDIDGSSYAFSDYSWEPRDGEIIFTCEEVPKAENIEGTAARYLHAIYCPQSKTIKHLDGALRIYTPEEILLRLTCHVRIGGKFGKRIKVFRLDAPISREIFSSLVKSFFLWNRDVSDYLDNVLPA